MNITRLIAMSFATGGILIGANAMAAKKCNIVGTYTDNLGSTIIFKTAKVGTATNSNICAATYKLKVTADTSTAIDTTGKAKGCGNLTGDFKPNYPTCTSATGTVTITGIGTFNDTITKQSDAVVSTRATPDTSDLEKGIR